MKAATLAVITVVTMVAACSETSRDPVENGGLPALTPNNANVTLPYGESSILAFTASNVSITGVTLRIVTETRMLPDFPVLDQTDLKGGKLTAIGVGRVVLEASAPNTRSASINVQVVVNKAVVVAFPDADTKVVPGATLTLKGFGLNHVLGLMIDEHPITIDARDSTSIRFRLPDAVFNAGGRCGGASRRTIDVAGAELAVPVRVVVPRPGELTLAVGDFKYLTAGEVSCLKFAATGIEAHYFLAALDVKSLNRAKHGAREYDWRDRFSIEHSDSSGKAQPIGTTSSPTSRWRGVLLHESVRRSLSPTASAQQAPLVEGDTFAALTYRYSGDWGIPTYVPAQVLKSYGNYLLLAIRLGDTISSAELATLDSALSFISSAGVPALNEMFKTGPPVSIPSTGQFTLLIDSQMHGPWTVWALDGPTVLSANVLQRRTMGEGETQSSNRVRAIASTLAGSYQWLLWSRTVRLPNYKTPTPLALSGGQALAAYELERRYLKLPLDGQLQFPRWGEMRGNAELLGEYDNAEPLLHWFVQQRLALGEKLNDAFGAVLVGALNGLFGYDEYGSYNGDGLSQRMKSWLGDGWDLERETLRFALIAGGADDQTANPLLQNPRWLNMRPSLPDLVPKLVTGSRASVIPNGYDWVFGYVGFQADAVSIIEIVDSIGGTVASEASRPEIAWAIARIK